MKLYNDNPTLICQKVSGHVILTGIPIYAISWLTKDGFAALTGGLGKRNTGKRNHVSAKGVGICPHFRVHICDEFVLDDKAMLELC